MSKMQHDRVLIARLVDTARNPEQSHQPAKLMIEAANRIQQECLNDPEEYSVAVPLMPQQQQLMAATKILMATTGLDQASAMITLQQIYPAMISGCPIIETEAA